jgi:hypothetical protein
VVTDDERVTPEQWARRPKQCAGVGAALPDRVGVHGGADQPGGGGRARGASGDGGQVAWSVRGPTARWSARCASPGRAKITDEQVEQVIVKTLEETPADATHWSTRSMAQASGLNQTAVSRI